MGTFSGKMPPIADQMVSDSLVESIALFDLLHFVITREWEVLLHCPSSAHMFFADVMSIACR
jgi:hypothetical protein